MGKLIVPRHTADLEYIIPAVEVYFEANDWVSTSNYKEHLVTKLIKNKKESERKSDDTHYTKCSEIPRYFGWLERKDKGKVTSDIRITEKGKKFYLAFKEEKYETIHSLIMDSLENVVFGRNNEGCGSDSDYEAPNIVILSALLLDGITNKDAAYILGECVTGKDLANTLLKLKYIREEKRKAQNLTFTSDIKFIPFLKRLNFFSEDNNGLFSINNNVLEKYRERLLKLHVTNSEKSDKAFLPVKKINTNYSDDMNIYIPILTAIQTKPFLLLAGISGTGKSRIVREFAFKSCPEYLQDKDGTTPGNYCMIEVKPNWHDSTELLGYYSRLGSNPGYQFTKFVKFLVKAKMYPDVPFFVCLDEMNLAPVEQYFAEILSILETRKHPKNGETGEVDMNMVKTEPIIDARYFRELSEMSNTKNAQTEEPFSSNLTDRDIYLKLFEINTKEAIEKEQIAEEVGNRYELTTEGLTLPDNVVIIGTVNMDDTTHQFSRKVIDRAMTIEMNGGNLRNMFGGSKNLEYLPDEEQDKWQYAFTRRYVTADEVIDTHSDVAEELVEKLPAQLEEINKALIGTPFEVSYRVLNELTIMVGVMLDEGKELDDAIAQSVNNILLMKILPRIEGDAEMFALSREYKAKVGVTYDNRLEWLKDIAPDLKEPLTDTESDNDDTDEKAEAVKEHQPTAKEKIQEMIDRLNNQEFSRFWP